MPWPKGKPRKPQPESGSNETPAGEPTKTVEEAVEDAEAKGKRETEVEAAKAAKVARERACLSCGTILEEGKCPECGVEVVNGKQVVKPPASKTEETPPETPPEEKGLYETLDL